MRRRRARALMLQGTGSHAGKTVLAAGLCRLLARRGLHVLPFKSQNMALNAYVTADGGEMGYAQAMQAEAAGVPARVEMNPVLLKPRAGGRSQIVVLGKPLSDASAREYVRWSPRLWAAIRSSYETLAREADVTVIEGAGSPAEPNLMRRDLANMRVARMARAPVVVVGDIDRGGVFASLVGTMALLPPRDRRLVRGFVINKFRGDLALLTPAIRDIEKRTKKSILGVVPFLFHLNLGEEDSVALDRYAAHDPDRLRVAVVRLPHIANFTDFTPLEDEPDVTMIYAEEVRELDAVDLIVLPGSKDTIADLRFLRAHRFDTAILSHVERGGAVLGICGGYQMLGRSVEDPHGVESGGREEGLGLLPAETVFERAKTTRRVRAQWLPDGPEFEVYEIHMGRTVVDGGGHPLWAVEGAPEGCASASGRVRGTYLHGLLDSGGARRRVVQWARTARAAFRVGAAPDARDLREAAYDRLADTLDAVLDRAALRELIGA
jgi:adenosylcobyric acid synthase